MTDPDARPWDAVLVGAGPAGAVSAMQLARAGHRVLLLDRAHFPRPKPCGDCLSPEATRVLDRIGLLSAVEAIAPARLEGWRIAAPDGHAFDGRFASAAGTDARAATSIAVPRELLDAVLVRAAVEAGAMLREGVRVQQLLFDGGRVVGVVARDAAGRIERIRARIVIGADGLRSVVARRAGATARPGPLRKLSFTLHPELPRDFTRGLGEMHVMDGGCIGIAPLGSSDPCTHNVTCVTDSATNGAAARRDPRALIASMLDRAPALADRLAILRSALDECGPPLASGPFDRPTRFLARDGLALVGDAAGYYDPFTGQGVYQALSGAEQLAACVDDALRTDGAIVPASSLRPYARWTARRRRATTGLQRAIELVTARPRLMNRFATAIERAPSFADALVAATGDIAPVRSLAGAPLAALGRALLQQGVSR